MCDTVVVVEPGRVLFAKNSDRDANEAQVLQWQPRREHPPGATVRCTYLEIPQARQTHATLVSRPFWMWGAEMGTNEHGVTIGNEAVFTREPYAAVGLTGMDLLRLALERAESAARAVEVIVDLIAQHGQGGGCGLENRRFTYHNSFLVADSREAFVLETAGRHHAVERVEGARTISNALSIPGFAERYRDRLRTRIAEGHKRQCRTQELARAVRGVSDLARLLRDHGAAEVTEPHYRWLNGAMAPCMHAGGLVAASQTVASWIAELKPDGARHWATATAAPCVSLFKPVSIAEPVGGGPLPCQQPDEHSLWWRHERLHRGVMRDPARLAPLVTLERDEVETRWFAAPPCSAMAFAEGDRLLAEWTRRIESEDVRDVRPWYVRRYWARREG